MRTPVPAAVVLLVVALVTGCGAAPTAAGQAGATTTASVASTAPAPLPEPGTVNLTGAVRAPSSITRDRLAGMPQRSVEVDYRSGQGPQHKKETGVLLADLIPPDALATTGAKNDLLTFGVLAVGADGYAALVSYGEISPDFGNRGILLATSEDGTALDRPRLVVPGDVKGGRYVSDLVELRVVRTAG